MKRGIFITATDTGVGKTMIAAGLLGVARDSGLRAVGIKPVETGCAMRDGIFFPEDGAFLHSASAAGLSLDECAPWRFSLPASPARAAAMEGRRLNVADIEEHIRAVAERFDLTVVEGAGGLMVPIQERFMMIDLIQRLGFPAILVVRARLGTLNHTLLSVEALRHRSIPVAAIVVSRSDDTAGPEEHYTPADIGWLVPEIPVLVLPHLDDETRRSPELIAQAMCSSWPKELFSSLLSGKALNP